MGKVLGLILEINPFHNGHKYFIEEAIKKVNPELVIAVVSGNYTMRGDVSVIDKFTKTKLLLETNIDIVLELPFISTINSADYFALNAVSILSQFNITDLAFGVELDNLSKLYEIKNILDSPTFNETIKEYLQKGLSYSMSAYRALGHLTQDQELMDNFTLPNNTLAIQYLRSIEVLKQNINITLIKRIQNNYYDKHTTGSISSATSLRNLLENNQSIADYVPNFHNNVIYQNPKVIEEKLLMLLKYNFSIHPLSYFTNILGVNEGIENRIDSFIGTSTSYQELITNIQTKRYPINKIKRLFLHIILNTKKEFENQANYYLRLLGSNQKGLNYINTLPKNIKSQIITSFKNKINNEIVNIELNATKVYGILTNQENLYLEEFKIPILGGNLS